MILKKSVKFFSPLLCQVPGKLSLGRVAFWPVLVVCLANFDKFSGEWLSLVLALLTYNTLSKQRTPKEDTQE